MRKLLIAIAAMLTLATTALERSRWARRTSWIWANTRNCGSFRKEDATIDGNKIILHIPENLAHPVIRFGYDETAQPNLRNKAGLPAAPFEYKL